MKLHDLQKLVAEAFGLITAEHACLFKHLGMPHGGDAVIPNQGPIEQMILAYGIVFDLAVEVVALVPQLHFSPHSRCFFFMIAL